MKIIFENIFGKYKWARKLLGGFWWYCERTERWQQLSDHSLKYYLDVFKSRKIKHEDYRKCLIKKK